MQGVNKFLFSRADDSHKEFLENFNNRTSELEKLLQDADNFDVYNTSEDDVLKATYFSAYKGVFVFKIPGNGSVSFGLIGINKTQEDPEVVKHEYGHTIQLENRGFWRYLTEVAIPSFIAFDLNEKGDLTYDYYGSPWEHEANVLGEAYGLIDPPWPEDAYENIWDLIALYFDEEG